MKRKGGGDDGSQSPQQANAKCIANDERCANSASAPLPPFAPLSKSQSKGILVVFPNAVVVVAVWDSFTNPSLCPGGYCHTGKKSITEGATNNSQNERPLTSMRNWRRGTHASRQCVQCVRPFDRNEMHSGWHFDIERTTKIDADGQHSHWTILVVGYVISSIPECPRESSGHQTGKLYNNYLKAKILECKFQYFWICMARRFTQQNRLSFYNS